MKKDVPKAPTTIHGPLGITYHPSEKASAISDCLENWFLSHDLCDENHERRVETGVHAPLASVGNIPLGKVRPCDVHKISKFSEIEKGLWT
jgi:hypothetical protein